MAEMTLQLAPYSTITACRVCGSDDLHRVLHLGMHPLPDFGKVKADWRYAPLELLECRACGLVQLKDTVDRDALYRKYWYRSGVSQTMRDALADVADWAKMAVHLNEGDTVLDIGSNDGTLLAMFPQTVQRIGFEPSNIESTDNTIMTLRQYFSAFNYLCAANPARPKLIFSIAMFYDVPNPDVFVEDIKAILHEDGVWVCQMNDVRAMVEGNAFDIIGHEHLCLYPFRTFERLAEAHGLEIFRVQRVPINGGSIRLFVSHKGKRYIEPSVAAERREQESLDMHGFALQVDNTLEALRQLLTHAKRDGKSVHLYGASTRSLTILHSLGNVALEAISAASDRDVRKWTKLVPGTCIPIIAEEASRDIKPDYYLVGPYSFMLEVAARERKWMEQGGQFIVPIPRVHLIGAG